LRNSITLLFCGSRHFKERKGKSARVRLARHNSSASISVAVKSYGGFRGETLLNGGQEHSSS
jgi:hypothetical protein